MADNATLISVSAFSGLAGALLTQTLSGLFTYFGDKRKYRNEAGSQFRAKKAEIAENFYFVTGETMAILKKTVTLRKKWSLAQSAASLQNISRETKKLDEQLQKLNTENWKQNLVGLYFDVALSYNELIAANTRSHLLYLELLDLGENSARSRGIRRKRYRALTIVPFTNFVPSTTPSMTCWKRTCSISKQNCQGFPGIKRQIGTPRQFEFLIIP